MHDGHTVVVMRCMSGSGSGGCQVWMTTSHAPEEAAEDAGRIYAVAWLKKSIILCTKTTWFVTGRRLEMTKVGRPSVWHVCEVHATFDYIVLYFINSNNTCRCLGDGPSPNTLSALSTPSDQIRRHPEAKATALNEGKINNVVPVLYFLLSLCSCFSLPLLRSLSLSLSVFGYPLKKHCCQNLFCTFNLISLEPLIT